MDESLKTALLERFSLYLDSITEDDDLSHETGSGESTDLYTLFVELAGLRTEVRTESRLVKEALDQFRVVLDQTEKDRLRLEQQVDRARAETRDHAKALLRPLLLDLLDVRDRLEAASKAPAQPASQRFSLSRVFGPRNTPPSELTAWLDGQKMTIRRLDRILLDRQVVMLDLLGRPFDPQRAMVVSTVEQPDLEEDVVVEIARAGFLWHEEILRPAEVVVNKVNDRIT